MPGGNFTVLPLYKAYSVTNCTPSLIRPAVSSHTLGRATVPPGEGLVRRKLFDKSKFDGIF